MCSCQEVFQTADLTFDPKGQGEITKSMSTWLVTPTFLVDESDSYLGYCFVDDNKGF